jgi:hypothetical protein
MAKREKVAAKFEQYVVGMEKDEAFEAVSFFRAIPDGIKEDVKEINKLRTQLIKDICAQYGVKPLGAAAPAGKTLDKALIQTLFKLAKGDTARVLKAYMIKNPAHELTEEKIVALCATTEQSAKDLLAQV